MSLTFYNLAQHIIKIPITCFEPCDGPVLPVFLFSSLIRKHPRGLDTKTKYQFLSTTLSNNFLTNNQKEEFFYWFGQTQRAYFVLARFANLIRYKKAKCVVDFDMGLNEISQNTKGVICIYENNYTYLFKIHDLIHIFNAALTNSDMFFSKTLMVKNPFSNVPFKKSTLYNIYFFIRFNTLIIPTLIHNYFLLNFSIKKFESKLEHLIREKEIHHHVNTSSTETLFPIIVTMLHQFFLRYRLKFNIHPDFPKSTLVVVMKPYLLMYYTSLYSLIKSQESRASRHLNRGLLDFIDFNPQFGRKFIHIIRVYSVKHNRLVRKQMVTFNSSKPAKRSSCFLTSHTN
jgi:hypothetical protein